METFHQTLSAHIQPLNVNYVIKQEMYGDIILVLCDGWGDS
jgi:hypothetical protein